MINKETYKRELIRMWDSLRDDKYKIYNACNGVSCNKCPLHGIGCSEPLSSYEVVEIVKKWSEQHPQKKHKISQLEYDILRTAINFSSEDDTFDDVDILSGLLENGYFEGATGSMYIGEYYNNCEVKEDV